MKKSSVFYSMAVGAYVAFGALTLNVAEAAPIPGLFTTGVDDTNTVLALGAQDTHYQVQETGTQAITMNNVPGVFIPNDATSLWVWENANGQPTNVFRTFRTTFDLTGLAPTTASISGLWAVDNAGLDILINGVSTGNVNVINGFSSFTAFDITSGFVGGLNTLDFVIQDLGVISGFRVGSISGTADEQSSGPGGDPTAVPEPATITMLGAGLAGLGFVAWRRRRKN